MNNFDNTILTYKHNVCDVIRNFMIIVIGYRIAKYESPPQTENVTYIISYWIIDFTENQVKNQNTLKIIKYMSDCVCWKC